MPGLRTHPQFERHLTYAAAGHCPRHYAMLDAVRAGHRPERKPSDSLALGILVHLGLARLYMNQKIGRGWFAAEAWDEMQLLGPAACNREDIGPLLETAKQAVGQYADHWEEMRKEWVVLDVNPADGESPADWWVLGGGFLTYPDLVVQIADDVVVLDHKTGKYALKASDWEFDPQQLTQACAVKQAHPGRRILYGIDYLQRPGYRSTVWSFPAPPMWELTQGREDIAVEWLAMNQNRLRYYEVTYGPKPSWPCDPAQCATRYGPCEWYADCFGTEGGDDGTE